MQNRVNIRQQLRHGWLKKPIGSRQYQPWLLDKASLTLHLKKRYKRFSVQNVKLSFDQPFNDELDMLCNLTQGNPLIRDVILLGNQQPIVFAHSILPKQSLRGAWYSLGKLGNKPLGEALFANPKVKRTKLMFKKINKHHALFQQIQKHLHIDEHYLWARRSSFHLNGANILVTEVFLPAILDKA